MKLLYEKDPLLFNPYGMIAVNPQRYPDINIRGANALIDWMTSERGQQMIGQFKKFDQVLFTPNADSYRIVEN